MLIITMYDVYAHLRQYQLRPHILFHCLAQTFIVSAVRSSSALC